MDRATLILVFSFLVLVFGIYIVLILTQRRFQLEDKE
tara:strand:+ start:571 stop:681 length:111 start_codon:yes stop_codon:yes gene_type:complete